MILLQYSINSPLGYIGASSGEFNLSNFSPSECSISFLWYKSRCFRYLNVHMWYFWLLSICMVCWLHSCSRTQGWDQQSLTSHSLDSSLCSLSTEWNGRWPYTLLPSSTPACTCMCSNWLWRPVIRLIGFHSVYLLVTTWVNQVLQNLVETRSRQK